MTARYPRSVAGNANGAPGECFSQFGSGTRSAKKARRVIILLLPRGGSARSPAKNRMGHGGSPPRSRGFRRGASAAQGVLKSFPLRFFYVEPCARLNLLSAPCRYNERAFWYQPEPRA